MRKDVSAGDNGCGAEALLDAGGNAQREKVDDRFYATCDCLRADDWSRVNTQNPHVILLKRSEKYADIAPDVDHKRAAGKDKSPAEIVRHIAIMFSPRRRS